MRMIYWIINEGLWTVAEQRRRQNRKMSYPFFFPLFFCPVHIPAIFKFERIGVRRCKKAVAWYNKRADFLPAIYRIVNEENPRTKSQIERLPFFSRSKNNLPGISISSRYVVVETHECLLRNIDFVRATVFSNTRLFLQIIIITNIHTYVCMYVYVHTNRNAHECSNDKFAVVLYWDLLWTRIT